MNDEISCVNSIFEQPWWLDIVAQGKWKEILVRDDNEDIIARMPYVQDNNKIVMPEKTQNLGIWIKPEYRNDYSKIKEIIFEIDETLSKYKNVNHSLSPKLEYILPFRWKGYSFETSFTYRISDLTDLDKVYGGFSKKAKEHIKYAQKRVEIREGTDFNRLWEQLELTYGLQGRKYKVSKDVSRAIFEKTIARGNGIYLEAVDSEENVHSSALFVFDENVFYYLTGARDPKYSKSRSQHLLIWEAIRIASQKSRVFDFEGSMVEGVEEFFRQFGGICTPYYTIRKNSLLGDVLEASKPRVKRALGYKI